MELPKFIAATIIDLLKANNDWMLMFFKFFKRFLVCYLLSIIVDSFF